MQKPIWEHVSTEMVKLRQVVYLKGHLQLSKFSFAEQLTERAGECREWNTSIGDSQMLTPLSASYWANYRTSLSLICKRRRS